MKLKEDFGFVALSGLPRTGSTLLSSILSQNPDIHAEGHSAVCQLMWDMKVSCENDWAVKAIKANRRDKTQEDLISSIPKIYYKDTNAKYIVDKSRSWTLPDNVELIKKYITPNPKIIVMVRPLQEIVQSFVNLRERNGLPEVSEASLWLPNTEPLTRPLMGVEYARINNNGEYFFVEYDELVNNPKKTIEDIYEFCEWESFEHNFEEIINPHPEDDTVWDMPNLHEVRPTIAKR